MIALRALLSLALLLPALALGQVRTPVATDDFNRETLGANWTQTNPNWGNIQIGSSTVVTGASSGQDDQIQSAVWTGAGSFTADQYSELTIINLDWLSAAHSIGVSCRNSTDQNAARDNYHVVILSDSPGPTYTTELVKIVNGTRTELHSAAQAWDESDEIGINCVGSTISVTRNGVELGGDWTQEDEDLTTGAPGILAADNVVTGDDWVGGNVGADTSVTISSVTPSAFEDTDTGIVIAGANFGAMQGDVLICPTDDVEDVDCEAQTVTAWADDEITFTAVIGSNTPMQTAYLFVIRDDDSESNAAGAEVMFTEPPTLSAATPSGTLGTTTTATIGATTDQSSGTFYAVVDDAGGIADITASQIKSGDDSGDNDAIAACSGSISTSSPSCGVSGLTANTTYSYAAIQAADTGDSNIVTGTFTTAEESAGSAVGPLNYYRRLLLK